MQMLKTEQMSKVKQEIPLNKELFMTSRVISFNEMFMLRDQIFAKVSLFGLLTFLLLKGGKEIKISIRRLLFFFLI